MVVFGRDVGSLLGRCVRLLVVPEAAERALDVEIEPSRGHIHIHGDRRTIRVEWHSVE